MAAVPSSAPTQAKFLPLQQSEDAADPEPEGAARVLGPHAGSFAALTSSRASTLRFLTYLGTTALLGLGALLGVASLRSSGSAGNAESVVGLLRVHHRHQHHQHCHTVQKDDACWDHIEWAMTKGIKAHPEKFANLDKTSGRLGFQDAVHRHWPHKCPAPCWPAPANIVCEAPLVLFDDRCHTAGPGESCSKEIEWSMTTGIKQHPEWYPELSASPIRADFQDHIYRTLPSRCPKPCGGVAEGGTCVCPPPLVMGGLDKSGHPMCRDAQEMQTMTFYMYRAQSDVLHPFENLNAGDLAGIMWYLHNEIVQTTPRNFNVTRILRYKVTVKNPAEFFHEFGKQFGPYVPFDNAKCAVMGCNEIWSQHGFVVGCKNLDRRMGNYVRDMSPVEKAALYDSDSSDVVTGFVRKLAWAFPLPFLSQGSGDKAEKHKGSHGDEAEKHADSQVHLRTKSETTTTTTTTRLTTTSTRSTTTSSTSTTVTTTRLDGYHGGVWYSLPGSCPSMEREKKTAACSQDVPGGRCKGLTWDGTCTYQVEPAGEISLDELTGIHNYAAFVKAGGVEYDHKRDAGKHAHFWNGKLDRDQCTWRMQQVLKLFSKKYPQFPESFPAPPCS